MNSSNTLSPPSAIAARWSARSPWSSDCLIVGLAAGVQLLTVVPAVSLLWRIRSRFYVLLLCIVVCNITDFVTDVVTSNVALPVSTTSFWSVVSWLNCCGFTFHNYWRLRGLLGNGKQQRWLLAGLGVLVVLSNGCYTLYVVDASHNWTTPVTWDTSVWYWNELGVCNVWGILDGITNALTSFLFVRVLSVRDHDTIELTPGYFGMLRNVRWMLAGESVMMVSVAVVNVVQPTFDPLLLTFYLAEGHVAWE
ncbi:hypothetical protein RI367_001616 [Sorochytrium milnesiophthora]